MTKALRILSIIAACAVIPTTARAQLFNRADDTRTSPPEQRKQPTDFFIDLQAGAAYDQGNIDHFGVHGTLALGARLTPRNDLFLDGAADHELFDGMAKIDKDKGSLLYVFKLADHWNLYAQSTHARNHFLTLTYRTYNSAGACLHSFAGSAFEVFLVSFDVGPEAEWWEDRTQEVTLRGGARFNFVLPIT